MGEIVFHFLRKVRVVVPDFNVVFASLKSAFHEPRFKFGSRHEAEGVGLGDPFQVGRNFVSFNGEDEFISELLLNRHSWLIPMEGVVILEGVGFSDVTERIVKELSKGDLTVVPFYFAPPHEHVFFVCVSRGVSDWPKVSDTVQLEEDAVFVSFVNRACLDEAGELGDGADISEPLGSSAFFGK